MHELIKTKDGSYTLYNSELDETYHSVNGAYTESMHVFIKNGLHFRPIEKESIHILEVGFGTGLNALLTIENRPQNKTIYYMASEPFLLSYQDAFNYFQKFENPPQKLYLLERMFNEGTSHFIELEPGFFFRLYNGPIQQLNKEESTKLYHTIGIEFNGYDIIYFDAFAPLKQTDMWTLETLAGVVEQMALQSILTSYCAKGQFKRDLRSLGLDILSVDGPPGKREMTVALI